MDIGETFSMLAIILTLIEVRNKLVIGTAATQLIYISSTCDKDTETLVAAL